MREQARIQLDGRAEQRALYEVLPIVPGRGLAAAARPLRPAICSSTSRRDPYVDEGGIEYLFGWATADAGTRGMLALELGPRRSTSRRWALDRAGEARRSRR